MSSAKPFSDAVPTVHLESLIPEGLIDMLPPPAERFERAASALTDEEILAQARRTALATAKTLDVQAKDIEKFEIDLVSRRTIQGGEIRHYILEKNCVKIIVSYRECQKPHVEAYDKGRFSRVTTLLRAQILNLIEKIEALRIGFDRVPRHEKSVRLVKF